MVVSIRYSTIKKRSGPYWISRNTGNFFWFNSSLSNLYNNAIIYTIKKKSWEQFCLWTNLQNFPIHVIRALDNNEMFLYPTLTIQASSRLKRSANHLWNNSDVCRKKFGEWSPFKLTRIILRPLSALSLDEVAKRYITTGLFGLHSN